MPSAIIIGASRGLGLGLTRELLGRGWDVVATRRGDAPELDASGAVVHVLDMDDTSAVTALAASLAGRQFDHVLLNAGVTGPRHALATKATPDEVSALMWTNAIAPIRAARVLLPLVKDGGSIGFMSSILGSIALRGHAHAELYSASKAALNSLTRGFAVQDVAARPVTVLSLHPGWVKTDMGGDGADIDVATSVAGLADVIAGATGGGHHYLDYTGKTLPW
ncbi:SDR family oxidoreductase [Sandarakinorhabdus sp.]|uniref:SDR family oxidoreductase n=1 Tax=Sandarakinorhabdus sp. TaxID=1916663 RepID=UPI00286E4A0D|nr:SDR family oxidoreductase [Sandarakinorhabdus sp.]